MAEKHSSAQSSFSDSLIFKPPVLQNGSIYILQNVIRPSEANGTRDKE